MVAIEEKGVAKWNLVSNSTFLTTLMEGLTV